MLEINDAFRLTSHLKPQGKNQPCSDAAKDAARFNSNVMLHNMRMIFNRSRIIELLFIILAGSIGILSVIAPYLLLNGYNETKLLHAPLFPLLNTAWESVNYTVTGLILISFGGALGYLRPNKWSQVGISAISFYVIAVFLEINADMYSHNLWPIEFIIYYLFIGLPATAGAYIGALLHSRYNAT